MAGCIGCGCLSMTNCPLYNPDDKLAASGSGAVILDQAEEEVLQALNDLAPGFADYILDERGAVRRHVRLSITDNRVIDRKALSDQVPEDGTVFIFQALSGGSLLDCSRFEKLTRSQAIVSKQQ